MPRFDDTFKDEVRAKNDIVEVISSYVKLERRGNRYIGLCPFHGEKTPSFNVIPQLGIYHCFGCKASGDVFKFIQEREHLSFYEALVYLAKRAGMSLPREERSPAEEEAYQERRRMYDALEFATRYYQHQLQSPAGQAGMEYLTKRGISAESIRDFRLGWATGRFYQSARSRFSDEILQKVGLVLPRRQGPGFMDSFFDRVMFPITDVTGRVIGFGGRILEGTAAKYKNTAETPLFVKRHVLFGLAQAKEAVRARNQAILVEGYMDVIMPHQVGINNVVAPLGTALTDEQCRLLRQQAERVIVSFDSDTAGQMATLRGLEKLYDTGCDVRILRLPDGKDPDEYIRAHGPEGFQRCVDEAIPLVDFKLRQALGENPGGSPESKAKAVEAVARFLLDLKNDVLREEYTQRVADELATTPMDVPEMKKAIARQMNRLLRQGFQHNQPNPRNNIRDSQPLAGTASVSTEASGRPNAAKPLRKADPNDPLWTAERALILLTLQNPELLQRVGSQLGDKPFQDPLLAAFYEAAKTVALQGNLSTDSFFARVLDLLDTDLRAFASEMVAIPVVSANPEQEVGQCIENIKKYRVEQRREELNNLIKAKQAAGEQVENAILQEYMQLIKQQKTSKS